MIRLLAVMYVGLCTAATCTPAPSPFPTNRTASQVLVALGPCAPDGGLPALEQLHSRFDRPAWVDCMFLPNGDGNTCGVPCP